MKPMSPRRVIHGFKLRSEDGTKPDFAISDKILLMLLMKLSPLFLEPCCGPEGTFAFVYIRRLPVPVVPK